MQIVKNNHNTKLNLIFSCCCKETDLGSNYILYRRNIIKQDFFSEDLQHCTEGNHTQNMKDCC